MAALILMLVGFAWTCYQFADVGFSHTGSPAVVFNLLYLVAVLQLLLVGWVLFTCLEAEERKANLPKLVKRYLWMASYAGLTGNGSTFNGRIFTTSKKKELSAKDIQDIERRVLLSDPNFKAIALQGIYFLSYGTVVEGTTDGPN